MADLTQEVVYAAYKDPKTLGSHTRVAQALREQGYDASERKVRNMLRSHQFWQRTRRPKRVFMPIVGRTGQYQMDIMFFPYRLVANVPILTMVHTTSRFAMARVLHKRKLKPNVLNPGDIPDIEEAVTSMIAQAERAKQPVEEIVSDNEFNKRSFIKFLSKKGIRIWSPDPKDKSTLGLIERFNLTLRMLLTQYVDLNGDVWPEAIDDLLLNYNTSRHSRTRRVPLLVTPRDELRIRGDAIMRSFKPLKLLNTFEPGQRVRYAVRPRPIQDRFYKYEPAFSRDIKAVAGVEGFSVVVEHETGRHKYRPRNLLRIDELGVDSTQHMTPSVRQANKRELKTASNLNKLQRELQNEIRYKDRMPKAADYVDRKGTVDRILSHEGEGRDMMFHTQWKDGDVSLEPWSTFLDRRKPALERYLRSIGKLYLLR